MIIWQTYYRHLFIMYIKILKEYYINFLKIVMDNKSIYKIIMIGYWIFIRKIDSFNLYWMIILTFINKIQIFLKK